MRVVVSRFWHHPEIHLNVTDEEIGVSMPLKDFVKALVQEIGNPALLLTTAALQAKAETAADHVVHGMKKETAR